MADLAQEEEWFVYMLQCRDGKIYTGITNDFERRIKQHNRGQGCRFTKFRTPVTLLHKEVFLSKSLALKREAEIKGWNRNRKLALMTR
ncbi:MAG: GIY-YIG nuclease family protein [Candidatus Omnitrophota bacterium]